MRLFCVFPGFAAAFRPFVLCLYLDLGGWLWDGGGIRAGSSKCIDLPQNSGICNRARSLLFLLRNLCNSSPECPQSEILSLSVLYYDVQAKTAEETQQMGAWWKLSESRVDECKSCFWSFKNLWIVKVILCKFWLLFGADQTKLTLTFIHTFVCQVTTITIP